MWTASLTIFKKGTLFYVPFCARVSNEVEISSKNISWLKQ